MFRLNDFLNDLLIYTKVPVGEGKDFWARHEPHSMEEVDKMDTLLRPQNYKTLVVHIFVNMCEPAIECLRK